MGGGSVLQSIPDLMGGGSAAMRLPAGMIGGGGLDDSSGVGDAIDRGVLLELGLAAMEELMKVTQLDEPLWLPTGLDGSGFQQTQDSGFQTLNYEEYRRAFARVLGPSPAGFVSEATRDVGVAIVSSVDLVNSLMDAVRTRAHRKGGKQHELN
jgi:homeobox-leucine zipper protein